MPYRNPEDAKAYERDRHSQHQAEYKARKGEGFRTRYRVYMLKHKYGLTEDAYDEMRREQHNECAACGSHLDFSPHVDHDHATGKVRGLLCGPCNRAIGHAQEDVTRLRACAVYLESRK